MIFIVFLLSLQVFTEKNDVSLLDINKLIVYVATQNVIHNRFQLSFVGTKFCNIYRKTPFTVFSPVNLSFFN